MKPLTTTDKIKVTDGDALLWYNFKNGKGVYEVDSCLARDVVSNGEIFYYKRNAMWRKANLNKNHRVGCPYDGEKSLLDHWKRLAKYNLSLAKKYKRDLNDAMEKVEGLSQHLDRTDEILQQSNAEKQQWKQVAHTLADALEDIDKSGLVEQSKLENALEQFKKLQS